MKGYLMAGLLATAAATVFAQDADPFVARAQESVKRELKDPSSAQFRDVARYRNDGRDVLCGEVNAKNSYGGYVGFRSFLVVDDVAILRQDDVAGPFDSVSVAMCQDKAPVPRAPIRFEVGTVKESCDRIRQVSNDPKAEEQCYEQEPAAREWARDRHAEVQIAEKCNREGQVTGLYFMARVCVEREEASLTKGVP
ncbi:hypothetical protein [Marilutibacter alkalisoli]|uniref:Uncharacterized protein n=1 Tax=Marilutibacter alkalisoli TaxID=2591633 RepID=A0A514BU17_9GAMM|nr:hypothetical protein [Lysobacter alkalisoli]QDH70866.1 hypothetical protein FKV23_12810 [Lysobacter alkalisoli]